MSMDYIYFSIVQYTVWSLLALIGLRYNYFESLMCYTISLTVITNYTYELLNHRPDKEHSLHHLLTIGTILFGIFRTNGLSIKWVRRTILLQYFAQSTSILSNLRKIAPECVRRLVARVYMIYYVLVKGGVMISHYTILFEHWSGLNSVIRIAAMCFGAIHLLQLHFIRKILLILTRGRQTPTLVGQHK